MNAPRSNPAGPILVIFPGALGDLICLIPTLRAIARRHPGRSIELMARAELARFATGRLRIARGHSIDRREVAQLFAAGVAPIPVEARAFFGVFAQVYSFFAADNQGFRAALDTACGGRVSYFPFRPPGDGHVAAAYLHQLAANPGTKTLAKNLRKTGQEIDERASGVLNDKGIGGEIAVAPNSSIEFSREELDSAEARLAALGVEVGKYLLMLPGSGSSAKNWPAENFAALARSLATRIQSLVILGPAEGALEAVFAKDCSKHGDTEVVANRTVYPDADGPRVIANLELAEVAALARLSRCFVGNDSGVSHLAAAAGAPGLAIFGPTDPARWRPLGRTAVIRREPLRALTVGEVEAALREIIGTG
jgi:ADP-heptose:LPS heptosyltransferase